MAPDACRSTTWLAAMASRDTASGWAAKQPDAGLGPCAPLDPRLAVGAARTLS